MTSEKKNGVVAKKKRLKSKWGRTVAIIYGIWFLSVIAIFITAAAVTGKDFDLGFSLASIGGIVFGSMVGSIFVIIIGGVIVSAVKGKRGTDITSPYLPDGSLAPYDDEYVVDSSSKTRKTYHCRYCGFKADKRASECPKCGGPIE